jgi:hypothetical protein
MPALEVMDSNPLSMFDGHLLDGLQFCSKVYEVFEEIREQEDGPSRFRMRPSPLEKKLLEELLPICKYVQASYRIGRYMSVRWVDGNQTYDAELFQRGAYVSKYYYPSKSFLEVTCTMHPNEYLARERLEKEGGCFGVNGLRRLKNGEIESIPVGFSNDEHIEPYCNIVLKQIAKKSEKPYPENTTLIIQCTMNTVYMKDEWDMFIHLVKDGLPANSFDEIYLYDDIRQYSYSIYPKE